MSKMAKATAFRVLIAFVWSVQMMLKRLFERMDVNKTRFDFRFKSGEWRRVEELPGVIRQLHQKCMNWCKDVHVALDGPWMYEQGPYDGCFYVASTDSQVIKDFHHFLQSQQGVDIVRESSAKERRRV